MKVSEYLQRLSFGEFSNLAVGSNGAGNIIENKIPQIISLTNEALTRLYTTFILKESAVYVELLEEMTLYKLHSSRSIRAQNTLRKYIHDSDHMPFLDDIIKITKIYDDFGCALTLNDPNVCDSVYTPQSDVLQVTNPLGGRMLCINYQAKHPTLSHENLLQNIEIPATLEGALFAYTAFLYYSNMNTAEAVQNSQKYLGLYQSIINDVVDMDAVNNSISTTNIRFNRNGWI